MEENNNKKGQTTESSSHEKHVEAGRKGQAALRKHEAERHAGGKAESNAPKANASKPSESKE